VVEFQTILGCLARSDCVSNIWLLSLVWGRYEEYSSYTFNGSLPDETWWS